MLSNCLKCRKNSGIKNEKNGKIMLLSKWERCDSKKSQEILFKEREASLGVKTT